MPTPLLSDSFRTKVLDWLAPQVTPSRLAHVQRVETMAAQLAEVHHLDPHQAALAGLLHDLAKYFPPDRLLTMAQGAGITIDPIYQASPQLLHAEVGALVAAKEFGIENPEVLAAIANHTLGSPGMGPLSCVLYLADSLEPGRGDDPTLKKLRQVSRENLYHGVWLTSEASLHHLFGTYRLIHPRTIQTRNWSMQMAKSHG